MQRPTLHVGNNTHKNRNKIFVVVFDLCTATCPRKLYVCTSTYSTDNGGYYIYSI